MKKFLIVIAINYALPLSAVTTTEKRPKKTTSKEEMSEAEKAAYNRGWSDGFKKGHDEGYMACLSKSLGERTE